MSIVTQDRRAAQTLDQQLPAVESLQPVLELALDSARAAGATACSTGLSVSTALSVNVRKGEVETVEFQNDRDLGVTVYVGQRKGSASTADLSAPAVREAVEAAVAIARVSGEDPYAGLAEADRMASEFPDLDTDHPWVLDTDSAIELAVRCEAAALADKRVTNSDGASLDTRRGLGLYANSHGFMGWRRGTQHSLSCAVVAGEGEAMQRDYWYTGARHQADLLSPESVGQIAAARTLARLGARSLSTRQVPVLFPAELARGLIGSLVGAISGGALYRKASFLLDKVGEPVFAEHINIYQRPRLPRGMGSANYDSEGVATIDRELIANGVLQGYVLGSYAARRMGMASTGNAGGVYNLCVEPGSLDQAGILKQMGTGLLVTELMGQGANTVTGDYSRGGSGFWVENGEITYPVQNITIAGNLIDMYRAIEAVGNDIDTRGNIRSGSILVGKMTVAGNAPSAL